MILKPFDYSNSGIYDSKALTPERRENLFDLIISNSISYSIAFIENSRIDEINILEATMEAMQNAIRALNPSPNILLIDGNRFKDIGIPYQTIIKGDSLRYSIAAASILAKVSRDQRMREIENDLYPE